jgi:hypothetical protein
MEHSDFGHICECDCHRDAAVVFCWCDIPNCEFPSEKYISFEGEVDIARFGKLIMNKRLKQKGKL